VYSGFRYLSSFLLTAALAVAKLRKFDPQKFLTKIGEGRKTVSFSKRETVFAQGSSADSVFYIQVATVKLIVVSKGSKEAT
jgi:CRP/FNR family cyclic AMP-dependent transcriptional regulator